MAKAIEDAIAALQYKDADYTKVDAAIAKANALNKDNYKDFTAVEAAVNAVVRDKKITEQSEVDTMAQAIENAIAALQYKDAVTTPSTPTPTKTPAPVSAPTPTKTPAPVSAPTPAKTSASNRTTAPTKTPTPNKTSAPTATPAAESTATPTPAPTATPSSTPSPTPESQDTIPQDSHTSSPALWIILILVIGGAVFAIAVFGKKKKNNR